MGDNGHVAGIQPDSPAATADEATVAGYDWSDFQRLTMTPVALARSDVGYLLAYGANKKLDSALEFGYTFFQNRMPYGHLANVTSFFGFACFEALPEASSDGPYRGLYRIDNAWHLNVYGILFKVIMLDDERVSIVRASSGTRGPRLKVDEQGNWSFDMSLRVKGGSVLKRLATERTRRAQIPPAVAGL